MNISARVLNSEGQHHVTLRTNEHVRTLEVPPKPTGFGSSANGGELLFLALATCYCNDIYREAAKRGIKVEQVEVEVEGDLAQVEQQIRHPQAELVVLPLLMKVLLTKPSEQPVQPLRSRKEQPVHFLRLTT